MSRQPFKAGAVVRVLSNIDAPRRTVRDCVWNDGCWFVQCEDGLGNKYTYAASHLEEIATPAERAAATRGEYGTKYTPTELAGYAERIAERVPWQHPIHEGDAELLRVTAGWLRGHHDDVDPPQWYPPSEVEHLRNIAYVAEAFYRARYPHGLMGRDGLALALWPEVACKGCGGKGRTSYPADTASCPRCQGSGVSASLLRVVMERAGETVNVPGA